MKVYKDDFGNTAFIETVETFPYNGAAKRENAFRLVLKADYDNDFIYHVSVYETGKEALNKLQEFSCGTFQKII